MQFNIPKQEVIYVLSENWAFHIDVDHINGQFCDYFLNDGIGEGMFNTEKQEVILPKDSRIQASYLDSEKMMFNYLPTKHPEDHNVFSFWVYYDELEKLHYDNS